jgi:hypothetical protein
MNARNGFRNDFRTIFCIIVHNGCKYSIIGIEATEMTVTQGQAYTHIQGRWLILARAVWIGFFACAVLVLLVAIPVRWVELVRPTQIVSVYLDALGWPAAAYTLFSIAGELIFTGGFLFVGLIIFICRLPLQAQDDRIWVEVGYQ